MAFTAVQGANRRNEGEKTEDMVCHSNLQNHVHEGDPYALLRFRRYLIYDFNRKREMVKLEDALDAQKTGFKNELPYTACGDAESVYRCMLQ